LAFKYADLEGQQDKYVVTDERFMRPSEVDVLIGDSSKAKRDLNWSPKVNFNQLVERMVTKDIEFESSKLR
jgi:GDPmannose 4,6-dehydratase